MFAHSAEGRPRSEWEPLPEHLTAVARGAAARAAFFGWERLAETAGLLHDIGKASEAFQAYIQGKPGKGPDHSTAGAREAVALYPGALGRLLAFLIAGHHAGLADWRDLDRRLAESYRIEPYDGWRVQAGNLPGPGDLRPSLRPRPGAHAGLSQAFLARMLFSCLVDADFVETERFYDRLEGRESERGGYRSVVKLRDRLSAHMDRLALDAKATPVNALRARVLSHATEKAALSPGLFTLTVPTGGGKTLGSLSFALEHAVQHGLRRVVYVIPFAGAWIETPGAASRRSWRASRPPCGGVDRNQCARVPCAGRRVEAMGA